MVTSTISLYDTLPPKLKFGGVFDFHKIYVDLHKLFLQDKFKVLETRYKDKGSDELFESEIDWIIKKEVTQYLAYKIILKIRNYGSKPLLKNSKVLDGKFHIIIEPTLIIDYKNNWIGNWAKIEKFMKDTILEFYIKIHLAKLDGYCLNAQDEIKKIINSNTKKTGF